MLYCSVMMSGTAVKGFSTRCSHCPVCCSTKAVHTMRVCSQRFLGAGAKAPARGSAHDARLHAASPASPAALRFHAAPQKLGQQQRWRPLLQPPKFKENSTEPPSNEGRRSKTKQQVEDTEQENVIIGSTPGSTAAGKSPAGPAQQQARKTVEGSTGSSTTAGTSPAGPADTSGPSQTPIGSSPGSTAAGAKPIPPSNARTSRGPVEGSTPGSTAAGRSAAPPSSHGEHAGKHPVGSTASTTSAGMSPVDAPFKPSPGEHDHDDASKSHQGSSTHTHHQGHLGGNHFQQHRDQHRAHDRHEPEHKQATRNGEPLVPTGPKAQSSLGYSSVSSATTGTLAEGPAAIPQRGTYTHKKHDNSGAHQDSKGSSGTSSPSTITGSTAASTAAGTSPQGPPHPPHEYKSGATVEGSTKGSTVTGTHANAPFTPADRGHVEGSSAASTATGTHAAAPFTPGDRGHVEGASKGSTAAGTHPIAPSSSSRPSAAVGSTQSSTNAGTSPQGSAQPQGGLSNSNNSSVSRGNGSNSYGSSSSSTAPQSRAGNSFKSSSAGASRDVDRRAGLKEHGLKEHQHTHDIEDWVGDVGVMLMMLGGVVATVAMLAPSWLAKTLLGPHLAGGVVTAGEAVQIRMVGASMLPSLAAILLQKRAIQNRMLGSRLPSLLNSAALLHSGAALVILAQAISLHNTALNIVMGGLAGVAALLSAHVAWKTQPWRTAPVQALWDAISTPISLVVPNVPGAVPYCILGIARFAMGIYLLTAGPGVPNLLLGQELTEPVAILCSRLVGAGLIADGLVTVALKEASERGTLSPLPRHPMIRVLVLGQTISALVVGSVLAAALKAGLAEPVANVWKLVALYAVSAVVGIYHIITANKEKIPEEVTEYDMFVAATRPPEVHW